MEKVQIYLFERMSNKLKHIINILEQQNEHLQNENIFLKTQLYSETLIHYISSGNIYLFKSLINEINYPIDSYFNDYSSQKGFTLLTLSSKEQEIDFVKYLILNKKADVNITNKKDKWSALMYAVEKHNFGIVRFLLQYGADVNIIDEDGFNALAIAVDTQNEEMVKILLNSHPSLTNKNIIIDMVKMTGNEKIKQLIENYYGVEINEDNSLNEETI